MPKQGTSASNSAAERQALTALLQNPEPRDAEIAAVVAAVAAHGGLEQARERAQRLVMEAEDDLGLLPESAARETLRASLTYVLDRRR